MSVNWVSASPDDIKFDDICGNCREGNLNDRDVVVHDKMHPTDRECAKLWAKTRIEGWGVDAVNCQDCAKPINADSILSPEEIQECLGRWEQNSLREEEGEALLDDFEAFMVPFVPQVDDPEFHRDRERRAPNLEEIREEAREVNRKRYANIGKDIGQVFAFSGIPIAIGVALGSISAGAIAYTTGHFAMGLAGRLSNNPVLPIDRTAIIINSVAGALFVAGSAIGYANGVPVLTSIAAGALAPISAYCARFVGGFLGKGAAELRYFCGGR